MRRAIVVVVVLGCAYVIVQLVRPDPPVSAMTNTISKTIPGTPVPPPWPSEGEAAIGVEGSGLLSVHGRQMPTPLASITKLMTAYVVLHDHPLAGRTSGPVITINERDVATYEKDRATGDSVVAVSQGERLNELQALEALLIPSGDNIANLLARWDAGSERAFVARMNATAKLLGLVDTRYTDASGVTTGSVSTASAQARLAMADMAIPVFRSVIDMPQVTLPVAGVQYNVNAELGTDGIVGIKTGWTPSAGGCFVFAAQATIDGRTRTIVGAVLHQLATLAQPSPLMAAFNASTALLAGIKKTLEQDTVVHRGETLGHLDVPWGRPVGLKAAHAAIVIGMPGEHVRGAVELRRPMTSSLRADRPVGSLVIRLGEERVIVPVDAARALPSPPIPWRLTNTNL